MSLEIPYADGQLGALTRYKIGWPAPTNPTVAGSAVLRAKAAPTTLPPEAVQNMSPPTTPFSIARESGQNERQESQNEPLRKLSADICTTCRKTKHYGACSQPRAIPVKAADFNPGMHGSDPAQGDNPSTSANYHSAVSSISSLGRSSDGRPSDEQAASGFADLFRHQGIRDSADQPGRMYGGLNKTSETRKLADFMLPGTETHSMHEQRGPSVNPYEERRTRMSPPVGFGDEGKQRIDRMFRDLDNQVDTTNIGGGFGDPEPGPAALG